MHENSSLSSASEENALPLQVEEMTMRSHLCEACRNGNFDEVQRLVENGADLHVKKDLPLYLAMKNLHVDIAEYLLSQGSSLSRATSSFFRPSPFVTVLSAYDRCSTSANYNRVQRLLSSLLPHLEDPVSEILRLQQTESDIPFQSLFYLLKEEDQVALKEKSSVLRSLPGSRVVPQSSSRR